MMNAVNAEQIEAARERALNPSVDAGTLAHDVLKMADEIERLRGIVDLASAVAKRRVLDDEVAERIVAILEGQPDPARKARR